MSELVDLLGSLGHPHVVVVGDVMLDRYVFGRVERISPEAPIQVLLASREDERPGGAASVAVDLQMLEARTRIVGFVGQDEAGHTLRRLLHEAGVDADGLIDVGERATTQKTRMIAGGAAGRQQVLRVDREDVGEHSRAAEDRLLAAFDTALEGASCVVVSDYAKGVLSARVTRAVIAAARAVGVPVVVDPKGDDYSRYAGASCLTPNRKETREATGRELRDRADILAAGRELLGSAGVEAVVVTLDKDGMAVVSSDGTERIVPTTPREVYDVTGAGDVVAATLGLALGAGLTLYEAVLLANAAAGVEVSHVGSVPVTRDEVQAALGSLPAASHRVVSLDELQRALEPDRAVGRRIVFTNGCFDVLHAGHVRYLEAARREGDVLVVGLNTDASVRRLKGPARPLNAQDDRAELLASLACVDYVVLFDEDTPVDLVPTVNPDVLVKGEDYRDKEVVGSDHVESHGGRVVLVPLLEGRSTTRLVDRIRGSGDAE